METPTIAATTSTYYIVQQRGCGGVEDAGPPVDCLRLLETRQEGEVLAKRSAEEYNARMFYGYFTPEIREKINSEGHRSYMAPGETYHVLFFVRPVQVQTSATTSSSLDEPCWAVVTDKIIGGTGRAFCTHIIGQGRVFAQDCKQEAMEVTWKLARDVCNDDISRYDVYSDEGDTILSIEDRTSDDNGGGQPQEGTQFITALKLRIVSARDPNYDRDQVESDGEFETETAVTFRVLEIPRGAPPTIGDIGLDWLEFPNEPSAHARQLVAERKNSASREIERLRFHGNLPEPRRYQLARELMAIELEPANEQE